MSTEHSHRDAPDPADVRSDSAPPAKSPLPVLGRPRVALAVMLGTAAVIRLLCFLQMSNTPCLWLHRWDQSDMHFFDSWGKEIASGNILSRPFFEYGSFKTDIADACFDLYPEKLDELSQGVPPEERRAIATQRLWRRWHGDDGKRFNQAPLYAYLVGAVYAALSPDVRWVFAAQALLGIADLLLLYLISRRLFGERTALLSTFLAALCAPLLFYEFVLLRASVMVFMTLLVTFSLVVAEQSGRARSWGLAGLAFGAALLTKVVFLVPLIGVFLVLLARLCRARSRHGAVVSGMFLCGVLICLLPAIVRNVLVGAAPLSLSGQGAYVFVCANAGDFDPQVGYMVSRHLPEILGRTDGSFLPTVVATLRTHESVLSYLRQLLAKLYVTWHWYEMPNNASFDYYRLHAGALRMLPVTFAFLSPLGLLGLLHCLKSIRKTWPLVMMCVGFVAILLSTYVLSRFRLPLLALTVPLSAAALVNLADWARQRRFRHIGASLAFLAVVSMAAWRPLRRDIPRIRCMHYASAYQAYYSPLALAAIDRGDWGAAVVVMRASLAVEPEIVKQFGASRMPASAGEAALAALYSQVHRRLGEALVESGSTDAAKKHLARAEELHAISIRPSK